MASYVTSEESSPYIGHASGWLRAVACRSPNDKNPCTTKSISPVTGGCNRVIDTVGGRASLLFYNRLTLVFLSRPPRNTPAQAVRGELGAVLLLLFCAYEVWKFPKRGLL